MRASPGEEVRRARQTLTRRWMDRRHSRGCCCRAKRCVAAPSTCVPGPPRPIQELLSGGGGGRQKGGERLVQVIKHSLRGPLEHALMSMQGTPRVVVVDRDGRKNIDSGAYMDDMMNLSADLDAAGKQVGHPLQPRRSHTRPQIQHIHILCDVGPREYLDNHRR
eukprot:365296-Chlamydomonas_euryale.AAC.24